MYWRDDIGDGQLGVVLEFTIRVNGVDNCGVMQNYRVDVWHCNADGFYSHYATGGTNNGHSGANTPSNNANQIYCRGSQMTNSNGEVTFTTIFPGWYPGRTCHIHFAIYSGGTPGTSSGWIQQRVSQFTFPIADKNTLYTSNAPYSNYGADPLHPNNDNVFSAPAGSWELYQLGTLSGSGSGPYYSYYELAISGAGSLPLELIGFNGSALGQSCLLWWKTAQELNFSHFEVEYSFDGEDFETVGTVYGKGGAEANYYQLEDKDRLLYGHAYYRLKMIDHDGSVHYSSIVVIRSDHTLALNAAPVPAFDHLMLHHPQTLGGEKVMLIDALGRAIGVGALEAGVNVTRINLDLCDSGVHYLLFVQDAYSQTLKFLIEK